MNATNGLSRPDVKYSRDSDDSRHHDGSPEPSQLADPDSIDLAGFIRRHRVLIAGSALLAAGAAVVVTSLITPTYVATASVRIDQKPSQLPALDALGFTQGNALATELEILRGRVLAEEVVDSLGLQVAVLSPRAVPRRRIFARVVVERSAAPARYQLVREPRGGLSLLDGVTRARLRAMAPGEGVEVRGVRVDLGDSISNMTSVAFEVNTFRSALDELRGGLKITRRNRDAEIIDVSFRGNDAELASEIVNVLARRFVDGRQTLRQSEARNAVRFLGDQITRVSAQLDAAERSLQQFRERENIVSLTEEARSGVTRQAELQAQRQALDAERTALAALLDHARASPVAAGDSSYRSLLAFPTVLRSGMAADLMSALVAAEEQRNTLRARRTAIDPDLQVLNARVSQIREQIHSLVGTYLEGLTNQVSALNSVLARGDAKLRSMPRKERQLAELERTAQSHAATYSMLQTRLKEAQIAAASSDLTVRVVEPAIVPLKHVSPRPLLNLAIALVVGALLGGAVAFGRELTDRSLHTRRDLLARTGVPVLGVVPRAAPRSWFPIGRSSQHDLIGAHVRALFPGDASPRVAGDTRQIAGPVTKGRAGNERLYTFALTDAFAWLATNIAFVRREPPIRVLVVTSPLAGDGKTTVAANLALTFARNGRRVLLIDADLRAGRIAAALQLPPGPGLSDWLADSVERDKPVNRLSLATGTELDVIASGSVKSMAAPLLTSDRLRQLIDWAKSNYDYTVIDTAPVNVAADAALVAPQSDAVVIVARAGVTEREAIEFAVEQLVMVHAPIAGAVLNDVDLRRDGGYDRTFSYYGKYSGAPT